MKRTDQKIIFLDYYIRTFLVHEKFFFVLRQLNSLRLINKYISLPSWNEVHAILNNISQPHTRVHETAEMLISCFI